MGMASMEKVQPICLPSQLGVAWSPNRKPDARQAKQY